MSPEEMRIAIAEACGWKLKNTSHYDPPCVLWEHPDEMLPVFEHELPDYLNNLDEMAGAVNSLNEAQRGMFANNLRDMFGEIVSLFDYANATAAQRAEALLRTLNKFHPLPNRNKMEDV